MSDLVKEGSESARIVQEEESLYRQVHERVIEGGKKKADVLATGDLDRDSADQVLDLLRRLASEHMTTVVMVTHDLQASEYATRVVNLDKGELVDAPAA